MIFPRKLLSAIFATSIIIPYSSQVKADWDYWAIRLNPDASNKGYDFFTVNNDTGQSTLRNTKCWEMPNYGGQCETGLSNQIYVDPSSGDLWFENSNSDMYSYNLETNSLLSCKSMSRILIFFFFLILVIYVLIAHIAH